MLKQQNPIKNQKLNEFLKFLEIPEKPIKESDKTTLFKVHHKIHEADFILRICKNRDLSALCEKLMQIRHPNVVVIYGYVYVDELPNNKEDDDVGEIEDSNTPKNKFAHICKDKGTYILEEYVHGVNLEDYIDNNGTLSEKDVANIAIKICDALEPLHKCNPPVIHSDITPGNIKLRDDNSIKLFDFDVAHVFNNSSSRNTILYGTPGFFSPENIGFGQTNPQSDIYSLGCTMHYMLTKTEYAHKQSVEYNKGLRKIINKCTAKDDTDRYRSVMHLKRSLEKFLHRGKRIAFTILALLILAIIVAAVFIFLPGRSTPSTGDNTTQTTTAPNSNNTTTSSQNGDVTTTTTAPKDDDMVKKAVVALKFDSAPIDIVVLNNGTIVYLENVGDVYHLKTSTGVDNILPSPNSQLDKYIQLLHNPYTDELYAATGGLGVITKSIYRIDSNLQFNSEPVYTGDGFAYTDKDSYAFFSDGKLYYNAFNDNLIDTVNWIALGKTPYYNGQAVVNDALYKVGSSYITSVSSSGEELEKYTLPASTHNTPLIYCAGSRLYFMATEQSKDYIYSFDGNNFAQVVCLSDYMYYTKASFSGLCTSDDAVWLYNSTANAVMKFDI